jgi:hypothetical protein
MFMLRDYESRGREFESLRARQLINTLLYSNRLKTAS